nr:unnamed protein product [Callosobruchus analis]
MHYRSSPQFTQLKTASTWCHSVLCHQTLIFQQVALKSEVIM